MADPGTDYDLVEEERGTSVICASACGGALADYTAGFLVRVVARGSSPSPGRLWQDRL